MATLAFVKPWAKGIVPYVISHPHVKQDILDAIAEVERQTLIKFVERTTQADYLDFEVGPDVVENTAWKVPPGTVPKRTSDVLGYCPGRTVVKLENDKGWLALHEIGHVLGLIHEHQRRDRDKYVRLVCTHIDCESFDFVRWDTSDNQGLSYDPDSVMHYGADWQAKGGVGLEWIGNANEGIHKNRGWKRLTANDIHAINLLYLGEYGECADLIVYRKSDGYINNNLITGDARGVGELFNGSWTTGYTIIEAFRMNGKPYCVCYKGGDGYLFVAEIFPNGYIDQIKGTEQHWNPGYRVIKPFEMNGKYYCICCKEDGHLFTATISVGGYINEIKETHQDWTSGYTTVEPFKMNGKPYCIWYKEGDGHLFTATIHDNGKVDELTASTQNWGSGYIIKPFEMDGRPLFACYRKGEGSFFVASIDSNGKLSQIEGTGQKWNTDYSHMGVYYIGGRPYLTLLKGGSGYIIACSINNKLYVDQFWSSHWTEGYTSFTLVQRG